MSTKYGPKDTPQGNEQQKAADRYIALCVAELVPDILRHSPRFLTAPSLQVPKTSDCED